LALASGWSLSHCLTSPPGLLEGINAGSPRPQALDAFPCVGALSPLFHAVAIGTINVRNFTEIDH
jgi:hypothetical protein